MSSVRMRVASRHWCASRRTVSISSIFAAIGFTDEALELLVQLSLLFFETFFFSVIDDIAAIDFSKLGDVIKKLGDFQTIIELVHFDGVPRADFLVKPVF